MSLSLSWSLSQSGIQFKSLIRARKAEQLSKLVTKLTRMSNGLQTAQFTTGFYLLVRVGK